MRENQEQIDTLNKYKDDMERDKAILGEQLVEQIKFVQVGQAKIAKRDERIEELEGQVRALEEAYLGREFNDEATQTMAFEFLEGRATRACQTDTTLGIADLQDGPFGPDVRDPTSPVPLKASAQSSEK